MIIVRSPLRISLGGGGTDLPSFYKEHEGQLIAGAIDKYVYVSIIKPFAKGIYLKYSSHETVDDPNDIKHPIIKEFLTMQDLKNPQIEITTLADIPGGTGLGSSGSFTTALIKAFAGFNNKSSSPNEIAELACEIEIEKLNEPIGKQDQYIAAFGGISEFIFHKDDTVTVNPLSISDTTLSNLNENLLLFFTGFSRRAGSILSDQKERTQANSKEMIANLIKTKELGQKFKQYLISGDLESYAGLMDEHMQIKMNRSEGMSNNEINHYYSEGLKNGAIGGKLVGAGGGGFLMFFSNDRQKLRHKMHQLGLQEVLFNFDFDGTKTIMRT
jgi:D-glycero-alpha-D-manno-heptose-7-phosphate kinase